ncbi:MAG TPA: cysteine dioxygenase family protein [Blastocatellia bacterium]|nr:cysteine dioxygenase family protein [Blastocatellia bacterium]
MLVRDTPGAANSQYSRTLSELRLDEMIDLVDGLTAAPSLDEVVLWFSRTSLRYRDYERYRLFSEHNYARNLIARSSFAELLLLCWQPGQRTPIHDHGGCVGVVLVCEGMMTETMYEHAPEGNVRPYSTFRRGAGAVTGADVPDIHQLLNLEPEGQMVTLHCYAPPLSVLNTYSQRSRVVGHWREMYFSGGAGI